jgi:hypothetical protein
VGAADGQEFLGFCFFLKYAWAVRTAISRCGASWATNKMDEGRFCESFAAVL